MTGNEYRQVLPELELSLERYTDDVPDDGAWYLMRKGKQIGRYRSRKEAMEGWRAAIDEANWQPAERPIDARAALLREAGERWSRNRAG